MKTRKSKFTIQFKEDLVKEYLQGKSSSIELSVKYGISDRYLRRLATEYDAQGGFIKPISNKVYEPSFKLTCVLSVLKDKLSLTEASLKFGIPTDSTLFTWIRRYEQFGEAGLATKRGRPPVMPVPKKKKKERSSDPKIAALEDELEYLRAENAYLKKLRALIQEEELKKSKSKSKPSRN